MQHNVLWLWVPAFAGTTLMECARSPNQIGFPAYGIDAVSPPSTGNAWPFT